MQEDLTTHKVLMRQNFGSRGHKEDEYDIARLSERVYAGVLGKVIGVYQVDLSKVGPIR